MNICEKSHWSCEDFDIFRNRMEEAGLNHHYLNFNDKKAMMRCETIEEMKQKHAEISGEIYKATCINLAINHSNYSFPKS